MDCLDGPLAGLGIDPSSLSGGTAVGLRRPGARPFSRVGDHLTEFQYDTGRGVMESAKHILQVAYDEKRFLKDYLIDGSLVVEVGVELSPVGTAVIARDQQLETLQFHNISLMAFAFF